MVGGQGCSVEMSCIFLDGIFGHMGNYMVAVGLGGRLFVLLICTGKEDQAIGGKLLFSATTDLRAIFPQPKRRSSLRRRAIFVSIWVFLLTMLGIGSRRAGRREDKQTSVGFYPLRRYQISWKNTLVLR